MDRNLAGSFGIILKVITCNIEIKVNVSEKFYLETMCPCMVGFNMPTYTPWNRKFMKSTMSFVLIGNISEKTQEARNQNIRIYREHHTGNISRTDFF